MSAPRTHANPTLIHPCSIRFNTPIQQGRRHKAKPAFDPVVKALETAARQLDRNDARGAAGTLEAATPLLRELRRLRRGALAGLPDLPEAVDRLSDSAAILFNNCAIALAPGGGGRGLRLLELAEEFCTSQETRVRITTNRLLLDKAGDLGMPYEVSYGGGRTPVPYGVRRPPRKSLATHLEEIYYGTSPIAAKVWTSVVVLLIIGLVVVVSGG